MRTLGRAALGAYRGLRRIRDKVFSVAVSHAFARFGSRSVVQLPTRIEGEERIAIGAGVFVGAGSWLRTEPGKGVALTLEDDVSVAGSCTLSAAESLVICRGALLARCVYIADHAHAYDDPNHAVADQGISNIAPVLIGPGAWLGEHVVVMPGVTIGAGAVVGANSVVTHDVPDHSVAVGSPARVVRRFGPRDTAQAEES